MRFRPGRLAVLGLLAVVAAGQPDLHLKTRRSDAAGMPRERARGVERAFPRRAVERLSATRAHWLVQFPEAPGVADIAALRGRGARILGYVPDWAFLVAGAPDLDLDGLNVIRMEQLDPADKLSPALDGFESGTVLVRFHADVELADSLEIVRRAGATRIDSPSVAERQFLVSGSREQLQALAAWDEVEYIFPADADLATGTPFHYCSGAATVAGPVAQLAARVGQWSPGRQGFVALQYALGALSSKVDAATLKSELTRAMDEWARHVQVGFTETANLAAARTLVYRWGRGASGGPQPFDGPGRTLAYTYFPSPPNPEPIAGDLYFDDDENWQVGLDVDVFSVALHELGHALGLGHSDVPGSVMYPYYRRASALAADDIASIQQLYLAKTAAPPPAEPAPTPTPEPAPKPAPTPAPTPPPPAADTQPPALSILSPGATTVSTIQSSIAVRGVASDNVQVARVTYSSSSGESGVAGGTTNWSAQIPLVRGHNMITIRAFDTAGNSSWRTITVLRRQ
jgi:hypothetical protein